MHPTHGTPIFSNLRGSLIAGARPQFLHVSHDRAQKRRLQQAVRFRRVTLEGVCGA